MSSIAAAVVCTSLLGYAFPAVAESSDWKVAIELNDGATIVGEPTFKSIRFQTAAVKTNPGAKNTRAKNRITNGADVNSTLENDIPLPSFYSAWLDEHGWVAHTDKGKSLSGKSTCPFDCYSRIVLNWLPIGDAKECPDEIRVGADRTYGTAAWSAGRRAARGAVVDRHVEQDRRAATETNPTP